MKKLRKIALVIAVGMLCSVSAATENFSDRIRVNGTVLENTGSVNHEDTEMIPLRAVCEALGFEVIWDEEAERIELVKLPVYITCTPYEDGYTFAKTAPMKLGVAPIMINDRTYVPISFVDEILMGKYSKREDCIDISWGQEKDDEELSVYIKEQNENRLLVEEFNRGEIELIVTDDTVIKNADGETITVEEIDTNRQLTVKLSDNMTLSIPPIANALEITETDEICKTVIEGEITEVLKIDENTVQVILNDNQAALNIGDDTIIADLRGEGEGGKAELSEGMCVRAQTKGIATMSIPPQYPVTHINVVK